MDFGSLCENLWAFISENLIIKLTPVRLVCIHCIQTLTNKVYTKTLSNFYNKDFVRFTITIQLKND